MSTMSELTANKYRDLVIKRPTGSETAPEPATTVSPPTGGFLMPKGNPTPIPTDPLVAAYYDQIEIGGLMPGFPCNKAVEPVHPLTRLRSFQEKGGVDNGLASKAPVGYASRRGGLECGS